MKVAAITLLLSMAGASALGIKPAKAPFATAARRMQESLGKVQVSFDKLMKSRRLDGHEGGDGGLDMAGMMKPECQEACPGVKDMMMAFMEAASQSTTAAPAGGEGAAMMEMLCPHMETLTCMGKADQCKSTTRRLDAHEGGEMDMMAMVGCICVCPDLAAMSSGRRLDAHEGEGDDDASLKAMCANPEGTIGCMTSKTECTVMKDMMEKSMPPEMSGNMMGYLGIACEYSNEKCEEKSEMDNCAGGTEAMNTFQEKACDKPETTDKTPCCPVIEKMKECQGETCMKLSFAMASMAPGPEAEAQLNMMMGLSKACPEVGMPQSKDDVKAIAASAEKKMKGEDPDAPDATPADGAYHTIPLFGMVATVLVVAILGNI